MKKLESLGCYLSYYESPSEPNRLTDPDACYSFIESHIANLAADAWKGYRTHGRGIVGITAPPAAGVPFAKSCYLLCNRGDLNGFPELRQTIRDLQEYDPHREVLIGFLDAEDRLFGIVRSTLDTTTTAEVYEAREKRRLTLPIPEHRRGDL